MTYVLETVTAELASRASQIMGVATPLAIEPAHPKFGADFAIPCFSLAREYKKSPPEIAKEIASQLEHAAIEKIEAVSGFVNIWLKAHVLAQAANEAPLFRADNYKDKVVVTEYSDPNPFKALHAGHLYTTIIGDVISSLIESTGAIVHRINYGGDVGLHVGKAMWGIIQQLGGEYPDKLAEISEADRPTWVSQRYVEGSTAYENDEAAKVQIVECNKRVYRLHAENDHESPFARIYWTCRQWSYDGFDALYKQLAIQPFTYWPESRVTPKGIDIVHQGLADGVFEKSDGAVVFKGEPHGLHTRVFLNSEGIPTYEAKDLGLAATKWQQYHFDKSIIITANDIVEYMKVILKALSFTYPEIAQRSAHLTHGMIKLPGGRKMSSRKGNTLLASDIIEEATVASGKTAFDSNADTILAAIKYSFLKQRIGGDIVYEPEESVNLEGNSGPYLQYAHARARGILRKLDHISDKVEVTTLDEYERMLARKIAGYPAVVQQAIQELVPHHICTYLYELAQVFNRFYEKSRIIGEAREAERAMLVKAYAEVLKQGLNVLGITAPEQM